MCDLASNTMFKLLRFLHLYLLFKFEFIRYTTLSLINEKFEISLAATVHMGNFHHYKTYKTRQS